MKAQFTLTVSGMSNRRRFRNLILGARFPQTSKIAQVAADLMGIRGVYATPENRYQNSGDTLSSGVSARLRRTQPCNSAWTNSNEAGVADLSFSSIPILFFRYWPREPAHLHPSPGKCLGALRRARKSNASLILGSVETFMLWNSSGSGWSVPTLHTVRF